MFIFKTSARLVTIATLLLLTCFPSVVKSQETPLHKTYGLFINVHGNGNYFNSNIGSGTLGGLMGSKLGLSFKRFSIFFQIDSALLNENDFSEGYEDTELGLISFGIGTQYHFITPNPRLIPYAEAGFNLQYFPSPSQDDENWLGYGGYGPVGGGGIKYFVSNSLSLDVGMLLAYGYYDNTYTDSSGSANHITSFNTQLNVGFSWYPFN